MALAYSKKAVNRAGALWAAFARQVAEDSDTAWQKFTVAELGEAETIINWWRQLHARPLGRVNANIRYYVREVIEPPAVTQRLKRFSTIVGKLGREPNMKLTQMDDVGGCRVIIPSQKGVDHVVARLESNWTIRANRDYARNPKADGYRAVHLIVMRGERRIEVQLRTPWQDAWAQSVEYDTRRLRIGLKFGIGPSDLREYYQLVSEYFALKEGNQEPDEALMTRLRESHGLTRSYFPPRNNER